MGDESKKWTPRSKQLSDIQDNQKNSDKKWKIIYSVSAILWSTQIAFNVILVYYFVL